jgi:multidrug efflux pump subunit AcrA (membrane-fusion protein)
MITATGRVTMTTNSREVAQAAVQARGEAEAARDQAQAAREQAQAAREQAQAAREQAQEQRQEARDDAREAAQNGDADRVISITTSDGKTITLSNPTADALAQVGFPQVDRPQESDGPYVIGGISIVATAIVLLVALTQRYRVKMRGAGQTSMPNDLAQRLARMEAGIESVAVEVERISEGQRFTTRLLSDRERVEVPRG